MKTTTTFKQESLEHEPLKRERTIRLLYLHPSRYRYAKIRISLKEVPLEDIIDGKETYTAVSYVWGASSGDRPIWCGAETLLVTDNCLWALRYLRKPKTTIPLWIDSICINQHDAQERNHQVAMMGEIYELSSQVFVWLGQHKRDIMLGRFYQLFRRILPNGDDDEKIGPILRLLCWAPPLATSAWYERVWVLQELLLAKKVTIGIGPVVILNDFIVFQKTLMEYSDDEFHLSSTLVCYLLMSQSAKSTHRQGTDSIYQLIFTLHSRNCQNPRDKIFGISSLVQKLGYEILSSDYQKSINEVCEQFFTAMIPQLKSLALLYQLWQYCNTDSDRYPGWVPAFLEEADDIGLCTPWGPRVLELQTPPPRIACHKLIVRGAILGPVKRGIDPFDDKATGKVLQAIMSSGRMNSAKSWKTQLWFQFISSWCMLISSEAEAPTNTYHPMIKLMDKIAVAQAWADGDQSFEGREQMLQCLRSVRSVLSNDSHSAAINELSRLDMKSLQQAEEDVHDIIQIHQLDHLVQSDDFAGLVGRFEPGDVIAQLQNAPGEAVLRLVEGNRYRFIAPALVASFQENLWDEQFLEKNTQEIELI